MSSRAPITFWFIPHILVVLISRSLHLESFFFQWSLIRWLCLMVLPYLWVCRFCSYGFDYYISLVCCYFSIAKYRSFFIFSHRHCLVHVHTTCPILGCCCTDMFSNLYICSCLVVPLNILSFCKFWTVGHNVVYRFLVSVAYLAHWIRAVFYNSSIVRSCSQTLALFNDY